jgi:WD40-like Beta Propeller Repeat
MGRLTILLIGLGLLLSLAACAGGLPTPTATAIPLAATATASPRPTRPTATATVSQTLSNSARATETPTPVSPSGLSSLDDALARRTALGFLDRVAKGDAASAFALFTTEGARQGNAGQLLPILAAPSPRVAGATLLEVRRATASSYEARALLHWAGLEGGGTATQTATLRLVNRRGLWSIDDVTLGDVQAATPIPTRRTSAGQPEPQAAGRLVFQASSGGNLYVINADGSGLHRLTDGLDPAWSPAGTGSTRIAFTRWRNPWGVYLISPDGSGEQRVADGIQLKEVAWSPAGTQIAFTFNYGSSEPIDICFFGFCFTIPPFSFGQLWVADLERGELLSLPLDDKAVHAPTWSLTGNRIVYAGERGLAWIDLDGMEKGRFTAGSARDTSPSFSPDGQQIAFMSRAHDHWEIFLMNADGSGRSQLTRNDPELQTPPNNVAPAWSPDGKQIVFLSDRDGLWRIYVMNADGSSQHPMFGDRLDKLGIRYEWATERVISWGR